MNKPNISSDETFVLEFKNHYSFDGFKKKWKLKVTGKPYEEKDDWVIPVEMVDLFDETKKGQATGIL